jgi:NTE family protein
MNTSSPSRALVLGGGGAAGQAWEIGVLAGLASAGLVVGDADLVVGTSAGATVAVQVTGPIPVTSLYESILGETPPPPRPMPAGHNPMQWSADVFASAADAVDLRRKLGASAREMDASDGSATDRWRAIVSARFPVREWPTRRVLITALDARTGEPVVFDSSSGVDLVDAVAASTSSMTPFRIGEERYLDGGYRRGAENADLAVGYDRVLVLSPFAGRTRAPLEWGWDLASQVTELRAGGSLVETVLADIQIGGNAMDPSTRRPAAEAGFAQGAALASTLRGFWS